MMAPIPDASNPIQGLPDLKNQAGPLPVHDWNPPFCGDIDMRIASDGTWFYMNSPIGRKPLYTLFSKVLRKDGEHYFLVTLVEKCGIKVDDAPFTAVRMRIDGHGQKQVITFETNVDEEITVTAHNRLRFEDETGTGGLKPYVRVRDRLEALVVRPLFYDLVAAGVTQGEWFGIWSSGVFFPMQRASEISL
jgi:uncharacterized protein